MEMTRSRAYGIATGYVWGLADAGDVTANAMLGHLREAFASEYADSAPMVRGVGAAWREFVSAQQVPTNGPSVVRVVRVGDDSPTPVIGTVIRWESGEYATVVWDGDDREFTEAADQLTPRRV